MSIASFAEHLNEVRGDVRAKGELRRGLPLAGGHILPHVEEGHDVAAFALVGELFAIHPGVRGGRSLGVAYRRLIEAIPPTQESRREMYSHRFTALLSASREALPGHMRHAVALCEQHRQPIDWAQLLADVLAWEDDDRAVQRRLARELWG